jgi:hypothetical protein
MKVRTSIAAAGAAVVLAGTGALLLPAVASAHSTTHTLKFTAVTVTPQTFFTKTSAGQAEKDVNSAGKVIGYDVVNVEFNPTTNTASGGVTLSTNGGFLYGALKFTSTSSVVHGTVTGGTGAFKGATGTITGNQNKAGTRTAVTITYTTP